MVLKTVEKAPWRTSFAVEIVLDEGLTRREQSILFNSARSCEVVKMLGGKTGFDFQLGTAQ
ncbi:MAG: hypothetical protein GY866_11360 [Proteobacteria bacterium]|nr:hypothetical protein [Pseudomonadota bacterium]